MLLLPKHNSAILYKPKHSISFHELSIVSIHIIIIYTFVLLGQKMFPLNHILRTYNASVYIKYAAVCSHFSHVKKIIGNISSKHS